MRSFVSAFLFIRKFTAHPTGFPTFVEEGALACTGSGKFAVFLRPDFNGDACKSER